MTDLPSPPPLFPLWASPGLGYIYDGWVVLHRGVPAVLAAVVEANTDQIDNLVLPLFFCTALVVFR